ncbi:Imm63 family immunity protein [Pseudoduganella sp. HUAS MS19]
MVQELGRKGGIPSKYLQIFGCSPQDGRAHIEIAQDEYRYVVEERGFRFSVRSTSELEELLFWVLDEAAARFSYDSELANRNSDQDPRRVAFQLRIQVMRRIKEEWGKRTAAYVENTVRNSPYLDG